MSVEEQLRAYGRHIEQRRVPIVAQEVVDEEPVTFDLAGDGEPGRSRSRWILSAAAVTLLVAATVGLFTLGGGDSVPSDTPVDSPLIDPTVPPTTVPVTSPVTTTAIETETEPTTAPTETEPATTEMAPSTASPLSTPVLADLLGANAAAIGETVTLDDGAMARVNAVVVDAPPRNSLYRSDRDPDYVSGEEPDTLTEFEIERCLGSDAATDIDEQSQHDSAYQRWLNKSRAMVAGQWIAVFDDGTSVPGRPGYHPNVAFDPGGCVRAYIAVPTPDDTNVAGVILLPSHCCYGVWHEQFWQPDSLTPDAVQSGAGWDVTESRPIDGPLRPSVPPDTVTIGEPMATGFSSFDIAVLEVIDDADPRPNQFELLGELRPELPPQPEPGRKLVEVRAEICTPADRPSISPSIYAGTDELLWLIATDDNYIGTAGPESLNGSAGAKMWDSYDFDSAFRDPPVWQTSNLLPDGFVESSTTDWTRVPSPAPGECISGYVQIDLPDDATPVDIIVAHAAGGEEYSEVSRTRISDPS